MALQWQKEGGSTRTMFVTLKDGLGEWIDCLKERVGEQRIGLKKEVRRIWKNEEGSFHIQSSDDTIFKADSVILSTPSFITAKIIEEIDSKLSRLLLSIPYVSSATISLAYRPSQIRRPLDAFGFVIPRTEKRKIMASTWTSIKFNGRAPAESVLLRAFVGGANHEELVSLNDDEMLRIVQEDLQDIMGIEGDPMFVKIYRWEKSMPQYLVGHGAKLSQIDEHLRQNPGLFFTGCAYKGIGISDTVHEGEIIAEKAVDYLNGKKR